jgi:hypothetical protein
VSEHAEGWTGEGWAESGCDGVGGSTKLDLGLAMEERQRRSAGGSGGREGLETTGGFSGFCEGLVASATAMAKLAIDHFQPVWPPWSSSSCYSHVILLLIVII